jgi:hypothetical protein
MLRRHYGVQPSDSFVVAKRRRDQTASAPSHMYLAYGCVQNGPPARRSEPDWRREGAYLNGSVTDEQRGRRPIFNATLRAVAGWLFFRVARSLRINLDMLVAPALQNSQLTGGHMPATYETTH